MPATAAKLTSIVEDYLSDLRRVRASGGATGERSTYGPLANLLNDIGATLRPKVFCVGELAQQGAGHPDFGLYAAKQLQRGKPRDGQLPECGVVEVKPPGDDAWLTAESDQVSRYWQKYRLVLVTNTRDFVLLGEDSQGNPARLETFRLADSAESFESLSQTPRAFARQVGPGLGEYLCRALSHSATLVEPKDLAWLLASYARDGLARVEAAGDAPSLATVRSALEDALGVRFEGERGSAFFRSTLVQTLFYGVFSAWVLWARQTPAPTGSFNWHEAVWHLRAPVLRALFQQLSDPGRLQPLGLVEVLDWTAAALDRVDRAAFFDRFTGSLSPTGSGSEAVPYFYEPFLEAFDPDLRKQLGVWYTPAEVVRYMVARVDRALKDDLGIADGLAAENVYVLDPCCGTGAYLAEVLRRIAANLQDRGLGALTGARVKQAATQRVFGFEIMPAPFVVAHLQVGLTMQDLDAPLSDDGDERAGIFLTNALTGWEPTVQKPLPFPELEEERDRAEQVKQDTPILVILGNPPYNGFAGMAVDEERELSTAYRTTRRVRKPEGQGLNDLYVRFFRMAERRIAEKTGQGIVCFISNYSWLDGLSFTGMRERFLQAFDTVRIDNLHGDRIISEYAPDGRTSETVMAIRGQSPGIKVGTSIALLSKTPTASSASRQILYRDFHQARADERRQALLDSLDAPEIDSGYSTLDPNLQLGLPFKPMAVSDGWHDWPSLPDLLPTSFPGVQTGRDTFLIDTDIDRLRVRIGDYFNPDLSHEDIARLYPSVMTDTARFDARSVRDVLLKRGGPNVSGFVRYTYRPFDQRWLYWESETKLLREKSPHYPLHVFEGNLWFSAVPRLRRDATEPQVAVTSHLASLHLNEWSASMFSVWLRDDSLETNGETTPRRPNLSPDAQRYLESLDANVEDLFHHVLAVLHDPAYREANAGALRMEWPRIPLPGWPDGNQDGAASDLAESAARGRQLAALLDSDTPVPGVTEPIPGATPTRVGIQDQDQPSFRRRACPVPDTGPESREEGRGGDGDHAKYLLLSTGAASGGALRPEIAAVAVPSTTDGGNMTPDDFALTAGWGHFGSGRAVMPGQGRAVERKYTTDERAALGDAVHTLGDTTFDIYLNHRAYWRNIPSAVWTYKLGGYQVLKKWLSYRDHKVLSRPLHPQEVQHLTNTTRRIGAILMLVK